MHGYSYTKLLVLDQRYLRAILYGDMVDCGREIKPPLYM